MAETGWARYTPHALVATAVFEFMHAADELAGNWAPFVPFNDPQVATFGMGIFTLAVTVSLWWLLTDRPWGYGLAAAFGLLFLVAENWHYLEPANMTTFRWAIVILTQVSAVLVLIFGASGLWRTKPWRRSRAAPRD